MLGSAIPRLITTENGPANRSIANRSRRLQTAMASSNPAPFRASSGIDQRLSGSVRLRHQDDVAVLEVEVFVLSSSRNHLVVVERDPHHGFPVGAKDDNSRPRRELVQSSGQGEHVQHRRPALEVIPRRPDDLPYDGDLEASNVRQNDRSEEHTSELQSQSNLVCRLLLEKKKIIDSIKSALSI